MSLKQRWSALHHGIEPAGVPFLLPWLRAMWWLARPLPGVPPVAITASGVALAWVAALVAAPLPAAAAVIVLLAAVCDGLDGAVAVVADRATAAGARADAVADRLSDVAFAAVLWRCGLSWPLALLAALVAVGVDGVRRVRRLPDRITVAERPTWTICAVLACGSAAATSVAWPVLVCGAVWLASGALGLMQVLVPARS